MSIAKDMYASINLFENNVKKFQEKKSGLTF